MRKPVGMRLLRIQALLELAKGKGDTARIRWRSADLGSWQSVSPRWLVLGGRIRFQFVEQGKRLSFWISSVRPKPGGLAILLSSPQKPVPEDFKVVWQTPMPEAAIDLGELWSGIRSWLRTKFPGHRLIRVSRKSDLARTLSGLFLRVHFRCRGQDCLLVAADGGDEAELILSQALLWLSSLDSAKRIKTLPAIHLLIPMESSAVIGHRCRHLNRDRIKVEVWDYKREESGKLKIHRAAAPSAPEENKDFRWPVLGPFRWSSQLEQVLNLAPDLIRRYPRFQDYDSLRIWGLEFAQVMGMKRDRICFGVGGPRVELTEDNFECIRSLIGEILSYRRADSPDTQHPYYRLQAERWLEALILEDMPRLFPEMAPESVYSQIPVYVGKNPSRIDILGADRQGTLVVMELKISADPDLPVQALDYWGRVIRHNENGDFEHRGYFSEVRLNRQRPRMYLVSPVFSFHDSTEMLLRYLDPDLEAWKISINEDWRYGVAVLRRIRYRCGELE